MEISKKNNKQNLPPRNPNKRPCIACNITFSIQKENSDLLRLLSYKPKNNL
jgi:hypothetical protein